MILKYIYSLKIEQLTYSLQLWSLTFTASTVKQCYYPSFHVVFTNLEEEKKVEINK